ncbi:MAG: hypothetical protein M1840_000450 [Geoglossum simile]|nr:MAG: hypothetical protein M1840_000450 [Geoglossum simile]
MDTISIRNIAIRALVGHDCWHRLKPQPVIISFRVNYSIQNPGETDDIRDTLDYRPMYKAATSLDFKEFSGLVPLAREVCRLVQRASCGLAVEVVLRLPKAVLHAEGVELEVGMREGDKLELKTLSVVNLRVPCIIGVGTHERVEKQPVILNLKARGEMVGKGDKDYQAAFGEIFRRFEKSKYYTIEAFVTAVARFVICDLGFGEATVSARKPSAFGIAEGPGIEITRSSESFRLE